jgi:hypothetical protein
MKSGELIERVVHVMNAEKNSVIRAARNIRKDGLLTTGARGVNAPDMTPLDAARLLIAFMTDRLPGEASAEYVRDYGSLANAYEAPCDPFPLSVEKVLGRRPDTFENALAALIEIYAHHKDNPAFIEAGAMQYDPATKGYTKLSPPECVVELTITPEARALIAMGKSKEAFWRYEFTGPQKSLAEGAAADPRLSPVVTRTTKIQQGAIAYIAEGFR